MMPQNYTTVQTTDHSFFWHFDIHGNVRPVLVCKGDHVHLLPASSPPPPPLPPSFWQNPSTHTCSEHEVYSMLLWWASMRWQDSMQWWYWQGVTCAWGRTERMGPHSCTPPCLRGTWRWVREHVSRTLGLCTMVTVVGGHTEVKYREINKITVKEEII